MFSVQQHPPPFQRQQSNEINPFETILPLHEALIDFNGNKIINDLEFINNLPKPASPLLTPQPLGELNLIESPRPSTSEGIMNKPARDRTGDQPRPKRQRRKHDEIERFYHCGFEGCPKSYGTLNHLNAHVIFQKHGPKRLPGEFKEIRAYQKNKKKEELKLRKLKEQGTSPNTPYDDTLPSLPNSAPPTQTSFGADVHSPGQDFLLSGPPVGLEEAPEYTNDVLGLGIPFSAPPTRTSFFSTNEDTTADFSAAIKNNLSTLTLPDNISEALTMMENQPHSTKSSPIDQLECSPLLNDIINQTPLNTPFEQFEPFNLFDSNN